MIRFRIVQRLFSLTLVIAVDADPMHLAAIGHLIFAHDGNVILRLASHRAGITTSTGIQIDDHAPSVAFILILLIKRQTWRRGFPHLLNEIRMLMVFLEGPNSDRLTPFHAVMVLCAGQRVSSACLLEFQARVEPRSSDRTN